MNRARARARRLAAASLASWLALAGCSAARTVPDADRHSLARAWEGKLVYLRSSVNVLPFHADASRRLVTPLHLDSIVPVSDGQGRPVPVGPVEAVVPLGTAARVEKLEFPTGLGLARRPPGTPRDCPWVHLTLKGQPRDRPFVAVLPPSMETREEVLAALGDLFSEEEPSVWLKNVGPETRKAIEEKRVLAGMDRDQVALAWGRPERIRQDFEEVALEEGPARTAKYVRRETWTWPLGVRTATFKEGRLAAATPPLEPAR